MKKFYKFYAESLEGEIGDYLVEVIDNLVTRQIFVFGNRLLWADENGEADEHFSLTDQPEWKESDEDEGEPITEQQFEELWVRGHAQ